MRRVQMRWPSELVERVDAVAGSRGRTEFTIRALEQALSEAKGPAIPRQAAPGPVGSSEPVRAAASVRAPVGKRDESQKQPEQVRSPRVQAPVGELPKIAKRHWAP